jgi:acetyl esterase/lipase
MDAGFWSAMRIKKKWLRDLASMVFTVYYLIAAEQADEKVRKVRAMLTVEHLRVSWNKGTTPYLQAFQKLTRPRLMRYPPRQIRIPRPPNSDYTEPVNAWLYFDGPLSALKSHDKVVLDIPGGGFVAMSPRTSDDKLFGWAGKTGLPILSLDYRKAPEYPYPYALNECFDVYCAIIASKGRCIGLSGDVVPKMIVSGDSAGGNLATSTVLMVIESRLLATKKKGQDPLPIPDGVILMYPGLDMNIGNWMSDEQMTLIKDRKSRKTNQNIVRRKSMQYNMAAGTPHQSGDEEDIPPPKLNLPQSTSNTGTTNLRPTSITLPSPQYSTAAPALMSPAVTKRHQAEQSHHPEPLRTRLAMSSMISYFNDRILSPEMMRAMIILYIGPHNRPDFSTEYLLSPILAPDSLLAEFPKTYFLTGERDPLVDDTVIFAGRLRRAKAEKYAQQQRDNPNLQKGFDESDVVEVVLIPGISHGFLQFVGCFPEGWKYIFRCARWIEEIFAESSMNSKSPVSNQKKSFHHHRTRTESSGDEDLGLEMTMTARTKGKEREKKDEERKKKEGLLRDQLRERGEKRGKRGGMGSRKKSMVGLGSSDDLLGRRMLGLAGPLTRTGDDELGEQGI